jgi:2-oxoglutarate dehydrogenase complex dehydrogenase (E1) component-like enzyme
MHTNFIKSVIFFAFILISVQVVGQEEKSNSPIKNEVPIESSLSLINTLKPVTFDYDSKKLKSLPQGKQYSLKVDDVESISSALIVNKYFAAPKGKNSNHQVKVKTVDLEKLVPFIVKAIQEQQNEIAELKRIVASYEQKSSVGE